MSVSFPSSPVVTSKASTSSARLAATSSFFKVFFSETVISCDAGMFICPDATPLLGKDRDEDEDALFSSVERFFSSSSPLFPLSPLFSFTTSASAAMNSSYANTPTACERFKEVGPEAPVYFRDLRQSRACPAVGIATHACACAISSFVSPVRSFPKSTATFPRFDSLINICAATRAVTNGTFPLGLAVVAMTKVQSESASKCVS
mmetsp:Transcript_7328/g.27544  ORF Transcript_7328/g.27544 Transcript_7328/m.27544 type:complete len:205 (-) Transcript_7328:766-1380(-)